MRSSYRAEQALARNNAGLDNALAWAADMSDAPLIRHLGLAPYEPTWRAMQRFTDERDASTPDEIWLLEHPPVFTLGLNASREHLLARATFRWCRSTAAARSPITGPASSCLPAHRSAASRARRARAGRGAGERGHRLRGRLGVAASGSREAPGVYVEGAKLASIGLRIRRGASYHGLALNVSLDLEPFERINVCGYPGLAVTRLVDLGAAGADVAAAAAGALRRICCGNWDSLRYSAISTDLQAVSSR